MDGEGGTGRPALAALVLYFVSPPRLVTPGLSPPACPREITLATVAEYHPTGRMVQVENVKVFDYQEITLEQKPPNSCSCQRWKTP